MNIKPISSLLIITFLFACSGELPTAGNIEGKVLNTETVSARAQRQSTTNPGAEKQILFGDLHVHSTFSMDAFIGSLPSMQGDGLHPVADACDFARYCSDLDFWSINDHALALNQDYWNQTRRSIEQCNAVAGDQANPDMVSFLGFEWTQVGRDIDSHYGHKNVIFRNENAKTIPARPIAAVPTNLFDDVFDQDAYALKILTWPFLDWRNRDRYWDNIRYLEKISKAHPCPDDIPSPELPADCQELAMQPADLFRKLDEWNAEAMVIPHGNTWGLYTPLGSSWDKQLKGKQHDPERQKLIEVYSGHGNSEEFRDLQAIGFDDKGQAYCPEPTDDYMACCWRAGEIIQQRCDDPFSDNCQIKISEARTNYLEWGAGGHLAISGEQVVDWKNCGQCTDCFSPSYGYRPKSSAQYALAITNFDGDQPRRFRFGFMASSDNHSARPGTGYKEYERRRMTEAFGPNTEKWRERIYDHIGTVESKSVKRGNLKVGFPVFNFFNWERMASFFMTGGLIAVHSEGRDRDSIWDAMDKREVYGTSGPKILLWFDLLNGPNGKATMGSEVLMNETPHFQVRAAGSLKQKPGCPDHVYNGLSEDRVNYLCRNECYHPSNERRLISRIEITRIKPQQTPDEDVAQLIEDKWRVFDCPAAQTGCEITFTDPEFIKGKREFIYYARAIEEPSPAVNGDALRCEYNDKGECIAVNPCYGDNRTALDDDCLAPIEQRAWSSPIFVQALAE